MKWDIPAATHCLINLASSSIATRASPSWRAAKMASKIRGDDGVIDVEGQNHEITQS
jgi:hypothetical protein